MLVAQLGLLLVACKNFAKFHPQNPPRTLLAERPARKCISSPDYRLLRGVAGWLRPERKRTAPPRLRSRDRLGCNQPGLLLAVWTHLLHMWPPWGDARLLLSGGDIPLRDGVPCPFIELMLAPYLAASVWEHSVLLSQSHPDVWLFLAAFSLEPPPGLDRLAHFFLSFLLLPVFYLFAFPFIRPLFSQSEAPFLFTLGRQRCRLE